MAEQTLNEPLHGDEVIEAILDRVREKLEKDCYLNRNSAYDYFEADITLKLKLHDMGVDVGSEAAVRAMRGEEPTDEPAHEVEETLKIEAAPPNVVREETGQPMHVLSTNENGQAEVRKVSYKRAAKRAAKHATVVILALGLAHHALAQQAKSEPKTFQSRPDAAQPQQQSVPVPVGNPSALSPTEIIAVQSVMQEMEVAYNKMRAVENDISRTHPGYHLDERNGQLVPNQAAGKPPTSTQR